MGLAATKDEHRYTYGDVLKWPEDERWELIDGVPFDMSPAPARKHQEILGELFRQISNYLYKKTCKVYIAPFDVRLPEGDEKDEKIKTVVQPDISIICDQSKLDKKGCRGCPDLIIEIISPSTVQRDMIEKMFLYERFGVKEYWLVHPFDEIVMVFTLQDNNTYGRPQVYSSKDKIVPGLFPDLSIDLTDIFTS